MKGVPNRGKTHRKYVRYDDLVALGRHVPIMGLMRDCTWRRSCDVVVVAPVREVTHPAELRVIYERNGLPVPEDLR